MGVLVALTMTASFIAAHTSSTETTVVLMSGRMI
jgi:hypothetical protein